MLPTLVLSLLCSCSAIRASPTPVLQPKAIEEQHPSSSPRESLVDNTLPYNFTLSAVDRAQANSNAAGVPLVLGQAGAISGASFHVTSTSASYPYNDYPILSLSSSSLRAYTKDGSWLTNATSILPTSTANAPLRWLTTSFGSNAYGRNYTAIMPQAGSGSRYPRLAALGRADLWSLCPFGPESPRRQVNLVFNVMGETGDFVSKECRKVDVRLVKV